MSRRDSESRQQALERLANAGRSLSDAAVLFHSRVAERLNLGATDWKTLGLIGQHGPMTHRDLVDLLGLKPASVTNILDRLERRDWIIRAKSNEDGRRIAISLNESKASELYGQIFAPLMSRLSNVYERYSEKELEMIADALEEIARAQAEATDAL